MKEIRATNANLYHVKQKDGSFDPRVEVILIVSEPGYRTDDGGEIVKLRNMETFRFSAGVTQLEQIIDDLKEYRDTAKKSVIDDTKKCGEVEKS